MQPNKPNLDERLSRLYAAPVPESFETGWRADIRREESVQRMNKWNPKPMWKRLVPALCALVLVAGGLWAGDLDMQPDAASNQNEQIRMTRMASGSSPKTAAYDSLTMEASYDTAAGYANGLTTYGAVQQENRKLVRSADLTIRTNEYDGALAQVQSSLAEMGGYIENLYQYGETARNISLTMRVPNGRLDDFLLSLEGTGKVTSRSESTTDMTTQYADNEARLKTLYDKRDRLNTMMAMAGNVSELIEIENAIADTQYQIDLFESSQKSIDRQVEMSSVHLTLQEQEPSVINPDISLMDRIRKGFADSIEWLGELLRGMVVFTVMASPVMALCVAGWLGWRLARRIRNGRKKG